MEMMEIDSGSLKSSAQVSAESRNWKHAAALSVWAQFENSLSTRSSAF